MTKYRIKIIREYGSTTKYYPQYKQYKIGLFWKYYKEANSIYGYTIKCFLNKDDAIEFIDKEKDKELERIEFKKNNKAKEYIYIIYAIMED